MRRLLSGAAVAIAVCIAVPVRAQETPLVELSGGYQWLGLTKEGKTEHFPAGWYADASFNVNRVVGIVAHGSGSYDHRSNKIGNEGWVFDTSGDFSIHRMGGGVRVHARQARRTAWFGQFLTGVSRMSLTASTRATAPDGQLFVERLGFARSYPSIHAGGGMNVPLSSRLGLRVAGGWFRIFHGGEADEEFPLFAGDGTNGFEVTTGLVVAIGRR